MDPYGDHALAYPRTGLLARRAKVVERAWVRVAREAVGAEGQVVPQQWFAHTTATGVPADDRCRLDLVVHGATANGGALCCDARLVSPPKKTGHPHPCILEVDGAALKVAERHRHCSYAELARGRPAEASGPRFRDRRPLEHCCAVFRSRPGPAPSLDRVLELAADEGPSGPMIAPGL